MSLFQTIVKPKGEAPGEITVIVQVQAEFPLVPNWCFQLIFRDNGVFKSF